MKQFKTLTALVLALMLVFSVVGTALASGGVDGGDTQPAGSTSTKEANNFLDNPTFNGANPDTTITVTNLDANDTAASIQLVTWNGASTGTAGPNIPGDLSAANSGWVLTSAGESCGVNLENLLDGITAAEAATIAAALSANAGTAMTVDGTTASQTVTAPDGLGLYYVKVTANSDDTIYNPIFVSADYYPGNNQINAATTNIGSSSVAKKSTVTFDKQAGQGDTASYEYNDVKPGDYIPFKITTKIPAYGAAYNDAKFEITDTFSTGLVLAIDNDHPFTVTYGSATGNEAGVTDVYTSTAADGGQNYKITFNKEKYLLDATRGVTDVTITYWGKVTTEAPKNVNPLDNTADLDYSNKPGETKDKHDITRHYTFSIDANLLGSDSTITKELLKVGLDKDGNVITEGKTTVHGKELSPLAGANFTLTPVAGTGAGIANGAANLTTDSLNDGRLVFQGLDAGVYKLVENSAPDGFVKDSTEYYIKIDPTYEAGTDILKSYKIQWSSDNQATWSDVTSFTMTNTGEAHEEKVTSSSAETDHAAVQNRKGAELPSTGGIGTTIFYVAGIVMVLGAAAIVIARRKAEQE